MIANSRLVYSFNIAVLMLGAVLLLGACSITPMQGYSGPPLPPEQTALITSGFHADLMSIDGMKTTSDSVAVTPGEHTVVLRLASDVMNPFGYQQAYYLYSHVDGSVTFTAQAGHKYRADVDAYTATRKMAEENETAHSGYWYGLGASGFYWRAYVRDQTTEMRIATSEPLPLQENREALAADRGAMGTLKLLAMVVPIAIGSRPDFGFAR